MTIPRPHRGAGSARRRLPADESSTHGALADDGSWQVAVARGGDTWLDLRFGLGEVLDARTMTPDASILARIGWDTLFSTFDQAAEWDVREEMRRTADEGPDAGTPVADVLHAQQFRREFAGVADRDTMLELADQALTVAARALDAEAPAGAAAVRSLETTSAAVVFTMSDHGQVPTVVDEHAVTMPWGDLAELVLGGLYEPSTG